MNHVPRGHDMAKAIPDTIRFFVAAMKAHRNRLQFTQQRVAELSGVSLVTVNQIEGLKRSDPDMASLEKIANALNTSVEELVLAGKKMDTSKSETLRIEIGKSFEELRLAAGYSRNHVALRLEMSGGYLAGLEKGKHGATIDKLFQLAQFYQVSVSSVIESAENRAFPNKLLDLS